LIWASIGKRVCKILDLWNGGHDKNKLGCFYFTEIMKNEKKMSVRMKIPELKNMTKKETGLKLQRFVEKYNKLKKTNGNGDPKPLCGSFYFIESF
jgi:hypothetical protein